MPHSIHWEPDGVCVKFSGVVTTEEIVRLYEAMSGDNRSDELQYILTDYVGACRSTAMTLTDVKWFAALEHGASYGRTTPVWRAAIATDPSIRDFLTYFQSVRTSPDPFRVFGSERDARDWLNTNPLLRHKIEPGQGCSSAFAASVHGRNGPMTG